MYNDSRIVKARAVVDDIAKAPPLLAESAYGTVLKSRTVERGIPHKPRVIPNKNALTDELNRLKVEINQAEQELKGLGADLESARIRAEEEERRAEEEALLAQEDSELGKAHERRSKSLLEEAREEADKIMAQAQSTRAQILQEAQAEGTQLAEQAKNEGYLEGFSKGFAEASEEFKKENTPKAVLIADILEALTELQDQTLRENEENMILLSLAVASKILGKAIETDPAAIAGMLRGIVEENKREEYIKITLSPDISQIKAKANKNVRALLEALGTNVSVITDNTAEDDTITVETPKGIVDVSIQTQLDNLGAAIHDK